jgi:hypothetical protein
MLVADPTPVGCLSRPSSTRRLAISELIDLLQCVTLGRGLPALLRRWEFPIVPTDNGPQISIPLNGKDLPPGGPFCSLPRTCSQALLWMCPNSFGTSTVCVPDLAVGPLQFCIRTRPAKVQIEVFRRFGTDFETLVLGLLQMTKEKLRLAGILQIRDTFGMPYSNEMLRQSSKSRELYK